MTMPPTGDMPTWMNKPSSGTLLTEERMAAFIGPKWDRVYRRKLSPFLEEPSFVPTWNWAAALAFTPAWFLYRKLYLAFAVFFLLPGIAFRVLTGSEMTMTLEAMQRPENQWLATMYIAIYVSTVLAAGGTANWFLFRRARAAARLIALQKLPASEELALLARVGGVNTYGLWLFMALSLVLVIANMRG